MQVTSIGSGFVLGALAGGFGGYAVAVVATAALALAFDRRFPGASMFSGPPRWIPALMGAFFGGIAGALIGAATKAGFAP